MAQKLDGLLNELKNKRAYYQDQINQIDAVLKSLEKIDGISNEPVQVWAKESSPTSIKFKKQKLHPRDFAREFIRRKGQEVRMKDLFTEYFKAAGLEVSTNKKMRNVQYNRFQANFTTKVCERHGFMRKLYRIEGVGRETYLNLDSAIALQTSKTVANPTATVKELL